MNANILGLCETRKVGAGEMCSEIYRIIYRGGNKHERRVGIMLDREEISSWFRGHRQSNCQDPGWSSDGPALRLTCKQRMGCSRGNWDITRGAGREGDNCYFDCHMRDCNNRVSLCQFIRYRIRNVIQHCFCSVQQYTMYKWKVKLAFVCHGD